VLSVGGGFCSQTNGSLLSAHKALGAPVNSVDHRPQSLAPVVQGRKMLRCIGSLQPLQPPTLPSQTIVEQQQWAINGKQER